MPYILALRARKDIDRMAADLLRSQGRTIADRMIARLERSFEMLGDHPLAGRDRSGDLGFGLRSIVSSPCVIVYRPIRTDARILRVLDGRRNYPSLFQEQ